MRRAAILLVALALAPTLRANPRDEVLRLVPSDASFCFLLQNLRDHGEKLRNSPFVAHVAKTTLAAGIKDADEWTKLEAVNSFLRSQIGLGVEEIRDDICGDAMALVHQTAPVGQPEKDKTVLLVWVRKPQLLLKLITLVDAMEGATQAPKAHKGRTYQERLKPNGEKEFFFVNGNLFAISDREDGIREILALDAARPPVAKQAPEMTEKFRELGVADAMLVGWLNPRGFDAELKGRHAAAAGSDRAFLTAFLTYWSAADGAAVYATLNEDISIGMSVRMRSDALPESAKKFLAAAGGPSVPAAAVPKDAVVFLGGRFDGVSMFEMLGEFVTPEMRKNFKDVIETNVKPVIGKDVADKVLASLGPDWAFWVAPGEGGGWFPEVLFAVRVRDRDAEKGLLQAVDYIAQHIRIAYNQHHPAGDQIELGSEQQNGLTVRTLANDKGFPPGVRPALVIKSGYLLVGESPATLAKFRAPESVEKSDAVMLGRLSLASLRGQLAKHREELGRVFGGGVKFDALVAGLELFDRLEVEQTTGPKVAALRLRLKMVEPLRK